jgi:hypothetical protein
LTFGDEVTLLALGIRRIVYSCSASMLDQLLEHYRICNEYFCPLSVRAEPSVHALERLEVRLLILSDSIYEKLKY